MNDGVALTSTRHPPGEELIEAVARAICIADGVGPDLESIGLGIIMPKGERYKLWQARRKQAIAAIFAVWDAEPLDSVLDPESIVMGEIELRDK